MVFEHAVMQAVQSVYGILGQAGDVLFAFFTFFGEETFLLAAVFGIYWCLDKKLGEYLLLSLYAAVGANGLFKDLVRRPRPFMTPEFSDLRYVQIDTPLVNTVHLKDSFSFPSGHSQCSGAFFGSIAAYFKKPWVTVCSLLAVLAVMISRLYLGVHFPTDVLTGGILGLVIAFCCGWLFRHFYAHRLWIFTAVAGISLLGLWISPSPDTAKTIGVGIGAVAGLFWENRFHFSVQGTAWRRVLRLVLGAALLLFLRVVLKMIFPAGMLFDGLRYCLMGFAATGLWPWLFTRFRL